MAEGSTLAEVKELLDVLRAARVSEFELNGLKVKFSPVAAFVEPTHRQPEKPVVKSNIEIQNEARREALRMQLGGSLDPALAVLAGVG